MNAATLLRTIQFGSDLAANQLGAEALASLLALLRRDWAVRVLDALAREGVNPSTCACEHPACAGCRDNGRAFRKRKQLEKLGPLFGDNAARHAAALAVFPTLPADVRAELGECT